MAKRVFGKLAFYTLADGIGTIQAHAPPTPALSLAWSLRTWGVSSPPPPPYCCPYPCPYCTLSPYCTLPHSKNREWTLRVRIPGALAGSVL